MRYACVCVCGCVYVCAGVCDWSVVLSELGSVGYGVLLWFCVSLVSLWVVGECCLGGGVCVVRL